MLSLGQGRIRRKQAGSAIAIDRRDARIIASVPRWTGMRRHAMITILLVVCGGAGDIDGSVMQHIPIADAGVLL
jgi:hypothetical protein